MAKICQNCGAQNDDSSGFCFTCGSPLAAPAAPQNNPVAGNMNTYMPPQGGGYTNAPQHNYQNSGAGITSESTVTIVAPDEMVVATLQNGVLLNIISGEGIKNEEAFVTNKRVYVNTTTGLLNRARVEAKIDLQNVTATQIAFLNPIGLIVAAVLAVLAGIVLSGIAKEGMLFASGLFVAAMFVIFFFVIRKRYMRIDYAGGSIRFSVKKYSAENVRGFQKAIHKEKENLGARQSY